ncbi:hypothetical protein LIER_33371 [Lithospermum erythrorhizon]|uniref:Uncharacterized protein n=1 Tax=Lithospermum erythrorhizon TaxID=34254 RepID=A0AAV3RY89_LITER
MAQTKSTLRRTSPPCKRVKSVGGVKLASSSSSPHPSSSRPVAASASRVLVDGHNALYKQTLDLSEELDEERFKVEALEQELQDLRLQVSNHPWDVALLDQHLKRA